MLMQVCSKMFTDDFKFNILRPLCLYIADGLKVDILKPISSKMLVAMVEAPEINILITISNKRHILVYQ